MTVMAKAKGTVTMELLPLRSVLLASAISVGVLGGYIFSARCGEGMRPQLRQYFDAYQSLSAAAPLSPETVLRTLACYFRAPLLAFLLGFSSIGVLALPLLLSAQGFLLSFSLFSFAGMLGRDGFLLLAGLFGIRLLFVLPCTFVLGEAAFETSRTMAALALGGGKRPVRYGAAWWYRFAVCCVFLLIGSVLELWLTPVMLASA